MRSAYVAILVVSAAWLLGGEAFAGRPHRTWPDRVKRDVDTRPIVVNAGDAEKEIEWLSNFDEAAALAEREKRGLLILFTSDELWRSSPYCNFRANRARRAVRDSNAVPLRLMPPVQLDLMGVHPDEARKRRELYARELEKYAALAKRYSVSTGPALVLAAPDAKRLQGLVTPADDDIIAGLRRFGEMIESHLKAAGGDQAPPKPAEGPKPADAPKDAPKQEPKDGPKPPANPEDDF